MTIDNIEVIPIETIWVVFESLDVFLEAFAGMPPERTVDFAIELVPDTTLSPRESTECLNQS